MLREVLDSGLKTLGIVSEKAEPNVAVPMEYLSNLARDMVVIERGCESPSTLSHGLVAESAETLLYIPHPLVVFGCDSAEGLELALSVESAGLLRIRCTKQSPRCFALSSMLIGVGFSMPLHVEAVTSLTPGAEPVMPSLVPGERPFAATPSACLHGYNIVPQRAS